MFVIMSDYVYSDYPILLFIYFLYVICEFIYIVSDVNMERWIRVR